MNVIIGFWNEFLPHEKIMVSGFFAEIVFLIIFMWLHINPLITIGAFIGSMGALIRHEHKIWLASLEKPQFPTQHSQ